MQYQWARLIHHSSGLPVRQRRGSRFARGAPSPARVVADCKAKREIVTRACTCGSGGGYCDDCGHGREGGGCAELADLAMIYADHPDYRQEWAP